MHAASLVRFGVGGAQRRASAAPTRAAHSSPAPRGDEASNHATIRRATFFDLAVASIPAATPPFAGRTTCSSIGSTAGYAAAALESASSATSAARNAAISSSASVSSRAIFTDLPPPLDAPPSPAARESIARRNALGSHPNTARSAGPSRCRGAARGAASSIGALDYGRHLAPAA